MDILTSFKNLGSKFKIGNIFGSSNESVLGIDIGSSSVKAAQLRREKEKAVLETYGELSLGQYANAPIGQAVRLPDDKVIQAIIDLKKEAGIKANVANVSIPLKYSFLTTVNIPNMSNSEIEKAIPYEIKKYIPAPLSEVIFDWQVIQDFGRNNSEDKIKILIVAIYKDYVEKYKNIVMSAGFKKVGFEIEVFSALRSVVYKEPAPILIIDLGASKIKMAIIENGVFKGAYDFDKGFQDLTSALSNALNVDFSRAEEMKKEIGLSIRPENKEIIEIFDPILNYIFYEANGIILEYRKKEDKSIGKVYLTGGGALLHGLNDYVVNKLGVEVEYGNPFMKVEYPAFLESVLREVGPVFANSVGLALLGI